ncbi:RNA recognition domain-containing protein [Apiospora arundinis]|uniref:RNA recognition domain-containing protein n=1 Tax=Apiospora arundinis TaxID=335852 RepID=A0ABR2HLD9_9PEZI
MANPVGEDNWLAYIEEERRHVNDLEGRVKIAELFKRATSAEFGSMRIWLAYCDYFWSLFTDSQSNESGWSAEEQQLGRELFPFNSALGLWSDGYELIKYRVNDSHEFWNRWISIEQEQLARTRTSFGVQRITRLFRDRLQIPHATWDETSQMFSGFLSEYNNEHYESEFKEVTAMAQGAKAAYDERESRELKLRRAERAGDIEEQKAIMREYLDWETVQTEESQKNPTLPVALGLALYSRALAGIFTAEDEIWANYIVYISSLHTISRTSTLQYNIPDLLGVHQRAVSHCPWSGMLWARYILGAEEAGLTFQDVEHIKHAATNTKALDKNGMTGVIDMYAAWCGYLKRTAMNPSAHEDAVDIADVGLSVALEDVQLWGERLYKKEYMGDPNYRIERILVQYLTEKKGEVDSARKVWNRAAQKSLLAKSYDFWLNYYLWEMMVFSSQPRPRSPTPANGERPLRVPTLATEVLSRALQQDSLDWPERIIEVYSQHLNDYEHAVTLRRGLDAIHKARKAVGERRQREASAATAAYAAQVEAQQQATHSMTEETAAMQIQGSPSSSKRKRDEDASDEVESQASKRPKNADAQAPQPTNADESLKRDRENTSVLVTNLPADVTLTAIRKYFKEYGHIINAMVEREKDGASSLALIEFESPEEMQSALLRDNKYLGASQISVKPGTGLTIFVSNYPPTADEDYIRNLFKHCGEIFNIRFPSLKFDTRRRFCYLSFRDTEAAVQATKLNGKPLEGKYILQAKYSDPSHKKKRDGAIAEGRELHLKNVDFKMTEHDIRKVLEKYGEVQSVRLIKNLNGQSKGTAFATFANKEQAEKAVELNKTKLGHRVLDVELSKETKFKPVARSTREASADGDVAMEGTDSHGSGPTSREIQDRTLALLNVPDTVNDARLRALAEKQGSIVKLVLQPNHQGAIIEYADVNTMGRAMLQLDGYEIAPGRKLRTGSVEELKRQKGESRVTDKLMAPPQSIRRPGPSTLGGRGPKKALGFVKNTKTTESASASTAAAGAATNGTGPAKPKSNADFKAMFLGGKE